MEIGEEQMCTSKSPYSTKIKEINHPPKTPRLSYSFVHLDSPLSACFYVPNSTMQSNFVLGYGFQSPSKAGPADRPGSPLLPPRNLDFFKFSLPCLANCWAGPGRLVLRVASKLITGNIQVCSTHAIFSRVQIEPTLSSFNSSSHCIPFSGTMGHAPCPLLLEIELSPLAACESCALAKAY